MSEQNSARHPLLQAFNKVPFIMQVVLGLILGIIIAFIYPYDTTVLPALGSLFVSGLKAIAPLLVLVLVVAAIAGHRKGTKTNMRPILAMYFISMALASMLALVMSYAFPSTFTELASAADDITPPHGISEVLLNFVRQAVDNPVNALLSGNYVGILFWGVIFGLILRSAHENTKLVLDDLAKTVGGAVRVVIRFAPLGVMGLVYSSCTAEGGFSNLLNYVHVLAVLVVTMLLVALVINPIIVFVRTRKNPYPLIFTCISQSAITAFFTRSSAANIPVNLELCEKLKVPRETYSISIPLGCTINMCGAAVTIVVMTMAAVHTLGIETDFLSALLMCIAAVLCACGTSGIAGGSLMLIPLACSIFGISNDIAMQVVGIGFIIGVLQDSTETALNSSSDVVFTAAACGITSAVQDDK
ncbi:MAG: serine/threonine transporter SstT [Proteobacteria bacterium]|uniref:Serine/threonine transporter SstT n=1 Tax=Candidatus Avisuccinivibrio stercorigallinarum TaxID=2840704 RepID=A0A9D9DC62_9GAMM|nr:serine/threonine transporter SstT [Candidatus Avisuccinivibrio stercorigallinarum]